LIGVALKKKNLVLVLVMIVGACSFCHGCGIGRQQEEAQKPIKETAPASGQPAAVEIIPAPVTAQASPPPPPSIDYASKAEYDQVQKGMSVEQVNRVFGSQGALFQPSANDPMVQYRWKASPSENWNDLMMYETWSSEKADRTVVRCWFKNGSLTNKDLHILIQGME
jgi:hypothetical protein